MPPVGYDRQRPVTRFALQYDIDHSDKRRRVACPALPQAVHLIRHLSSTGEVRVLMTNLFDMVCFPQPNFGDLYLQR